jgi:hypothetical protein
MPFPSIPGMGYLLHSLLAAAGPSSPTLCRTPRLRLPRKRSGNIDLKRYSLNSKGA